MRPIFVTSLFCVVVVFFGAGVFAGTPVERVVWGTSKFVGSPEPPLGYTTRRVFENLEFKFPSSLTYAPGTGRLYVTELSGKIYSFENDREVKKAELFLDLSGAESDVVPRWASMRVWNISFDPDFQTNGHVYVAYGLIKAPDADCRLSRFTIAEEERGNPVKCDVGTEELIIQWRGQGHNGGAVEFSPNDPYLYLSIGDGGAGNGYDMNLTGQDVSDLRASILRIDVRKGEGGKLYSIPKDNPFVDLEGSRGEVYAYGMRNPWRMSFDEKTGDFWAGDVGQNTWESIYHVTSGSNFGWSINEGPGAFRPERTIGPTEISPPTVAHGRFESTSITAGIVYYGKKLPGLEGRFVYGDYDSGKVWSFLYKDGQATEQRELADSELRLVSFGKDAGGEMYLVDHQGGIYELAENTATGNTADFPRKLSETGLFSDMKTLEPAAGVLPYWVNVEAWNDGATGERHFAIPSDEAIDYIGNDIKDNYLFPAGTAISQTLSLETEVGDADSAKRIETRVLHFDGLQWRFYSYAWNDEQTDAVLVGKNGDAKMVSIKDAKEASGKRDQIWAFPARAQCATCHVRVLDYTIGFKTPQLNRDVDYGDGDVNQLEVFEKLGMFGDKFNRVPGYREGDFDKAARLVDATDENVPVADWARAYLHANCSHCHQPGGGGRAVIDLRYQMAVSEMAIVGKAPYVGDFEIEGAEIVKAGDAGKSILAHRMKQQYTGRMPMIGSFVVDEEAVELIEEWIEGLE